MDIGNWGIWGIGSILLGLALLVVVVAVLVNPLVGRDSETPDQPEQAVDLSPAADLAAQQEAVVATIRELDFDYSVGKLPEDEYQVQRAHWKALGVEILKQMEALTPENDPLEAVIRSHRRKKRPAASTTQETAREAKPRRSTATNTAGAAPTATTTVCRTCGRKLEAGDAFCPKCGTRVAAPARTGR